MKTLPNMLLSTVLLVSGALGVVTMRPPMPAAAAGGSGTGGPPYLVPSHFPPSAFHVSAAVQAQYRGRYTLKTIDQRAPLSSGTIYVTTEPNGSLLGLVQFYGYDTSGWQTSWMAILYNFQPQAHHRMGIELFDMVGQDLRDRMLVSRDGHGNLLGQLLLDGHRYAMSWQKTAAAAR